MELPLAVQSDNEFTFNLELPYYNWFYPLQHAEDAQRNILNHRDMLLDGVKAAYIHFPFCTSLCSYCPYIRTHVHDAAIRAAYVRYLIQEIQSYASFEKAPLDCVFFGGGSPSLLSPKQFADIMNVLGTTFTLSPSCEITVEANAMSVTPSLCSVFKDFNVSSVRIGVQSFNKHSRSMYQLRATPNDITRAVELVRLYGMNVSLDLLYGHHGQDLSSFLLDIDIAHELSPDTIEIYPLNLLSVPDRYWDAVLNMQSQRLLARDRLRYSRHGRERLEELGYRQWSGHGFARSTEFDLLYHRCVYGTRGGIVGFGPGAISFDNRYVKWNDPSIDGYMKKMSQTGLPSYSVRRISEVEQRAKKFVTELPYYGYCCASGDDVIPEVSQQLLELQQVGAIRWHDGGIALTDAARLQYASMMYFLLPKRDKDALAREILSACVRLGKRFTEDMLWL